jgi:hypothetical protein
MRTTVLNLAGGKIKPIFDQKPNPMFLLNLDTSYYLIETPQNIEEAWKYLDRDQNDEYYCNIDVFEFLSKTIIKFDWIAMYRFLEHIPFDKVLYFIYLLSTVTEEGACIDIIVPNYKKLAKMLLNEDVNNGGFEAHNILLTTEMLNEPSCPHASIWTAERIEKFFTLEGRFKILELDENYVFDQRHIYLRSLVTRV